MALATALPQVAEPPLKIVEIVRSDVVPPNEKGEYKFDIETGDGIAISSSGAGTGPEGAVESQGSYTFTHPGGEVSKVTYVAGAQGFQPQSDQLPVAPPFPHPIPQFVIDQIARAAEEDKAAAAAPPKA